MLLDWVRLHPARTRRVAVHLGEVPYRDLGPLLADIPYSCNQMRDNVN